MLPAAISVASATPAPTGVAQSPKLYVTVRVIRVGHALPAATIIIPQVNTT